LSIEVAPRISDLRLAASMDSRAAFTLYPCCMSSVASVSGSLPVPSLAAPGYGHVLVCASHRTGSNLLNQQLKASGLVGRPREYYSPELSPETAAGWSTTSPAEDIAAYYREVVRRTATSNKVIGVKVMWPHLKHIRRNLARLHPTFGDSGAFDEWDVLTVLHPQPKVIWIQREDKLGQAISMFRAKQSGVFSSHQVDRGKRQEQAEVLYNYCELHRYVEKFEREERAWGSLFAKHGITPQVVEFRQITNDPRGQAIRLLQELDFGVPEAWDEIPVPSRSRADTINSEWRQRFEADSARHDELMAQKGNAKRKQKSATPWWKRLLGR
jgi:trehalose 2-sulfotransferase